MAWLADDLCTTVRRRCRIPDGGAVMSDTELLACGDEHILTRFVPLLRGLGEEYAVANYDHTIGADISAYRIPTRAAGGSLLDVLLVDEDGEGDSLPRISLEERERWEKGGSVFWPHGCAVCLQTSEVLFRPGPTAGGATGKTLRLRYFRRPGKLVLSSGAGQISAIVTVSASLVTVVTLVDDSTFDTGDIVDVVQGTPHFDTVLMDAVATLSAGNWGLSPGAPQNLPGSGLAVGDWLALAGESPVVQLPEVLHPVLATAVQTDVYHAMREFQMRDQTFQKLEREMADARKTLTPRISGEDMRIINRSSPLRTGRSRWGSVQ